MSKAEFRNNATRGIRLGRLEKDGAASNVAIRRRLLALIQEREFPTDVAAKVLHKNAGARGDIHEFAQRYGVSLDWIAFGNLSALLQTVREARMPRPVTQVQFEEFMDLLSKVTAQDMDEALSILREYFARKRAKV